MKKKSQPINFKIKLTNLPLWAKVKLNFIRRDIDEFGNYGVSDEKISELNSLIKSYDDYPTDVEFLGNQMVATEVKNIQAEKIRLSITWIIIRVKNKFGTHSPRYRRFRITKASKLRGWDLYFSAKRVLRIAHKYLPELAQEGLTNSVLDEFNDQIILYDQTLIQQEDTISDRDFATEDRNRLANEIYSMTVKYCDIGKRIWESTSEAKYNDYIIYNTPSGEAKKSRKKSRG
jgi:hypothetical protein